MSAISSIDPALWRERYPAGVPPEIDADRFRSLVDLLDHAVAQHADRPAYTSRGATITYRDLDREGRAFAAWLQRHAGVRPGDRVALVMPNVLAFPVALFGALRAGGVVVNTNPLYTAPEMAHQLTDSGASVVVVLENMAATLADALPAGQGPTVVIARIGDLMGARGALVNAVVKHVKRLVPAYALPGAITLREALAAGRGLELEPIEIGPEDLAFLQYTGGTTGRSKGAMLTHRNLLANLEQIRAWFHEELKPEGQLAICALPLYHVFALTVNCLLMARVGGHNLLILNPRDLPAFVKELRGVPFTYFTGVNTLYAHLLTTPGFSDLDFSSMRVSIAGGMAAQRPVAERWTGVTGRTLIEGYGLTEASPVTCINLPDTAGFTGAVGMPVPSTEVAVRGPEGEDLGIGQMGELRFRGPQVMRGYWRRPEETAIALGGDGFLATGDLGVVGGDGLVRVVDRLKDMIVVSGFNVYPNEVEEIAVGCPGVREAACIGVPDGQTGESPLLFVATSDPSLDQDRVLAHLRAHLTGYKVPRRIEFRDELPKTPVGKVLRRALREEVTTP